jgi:hypothetical protein
MRGKVLSMNLQGNESNNAGRNLTCFGIAVFLLLLRPAPYVLSQPTPDALKGVTHSASLTFVKRDGTRVEGPISKIDATSITIQPYKQPPITIARFDLLQVRQGDGLLFSAISSWGDVEAAHVVPHEAFVLRMQSGKVVKGRPLKVTADTITLKHGLITTDYAKEEIKTVDYLRVKPGTDTWDYFAQESPELLFFFPETYYRLMGLEGRIPVRLYDASVPEGSTLPQHPGR